MGLDWEVDYEKANNSNFKDIQKGAFTSIGTNPSNIPTESGPQPGAVPTPLWSRHSGEPTPFIGKPNDIISGKAIEHLGLGAWRSGHGGDNYLTDIRAGTITAFRPLVTTGFTLPEECYKFKPIQLTHVLSSLAEWDFDAW